MRGSMRATRESKQPASQHLTYWQDDEGWISTPVFGLVVEAAYLAFAQVSVDVA